MSKPLWLTYTWVDNDEGDFDYLVQELQKAGVPTLYDKVTLIPGRRLWAQIADRISSDPLSGWAYLITPNSLASSACQEELSYALQRALKTKGEEFPLVGLLHNVSIDDIPTALEVRLCVDLADPDWAEQVRAAVSGTPPSRMIKYQGKFVAKIHQNYLGQRGKTAIEVRPRFGELTFWRIAFPSDGPQPVDWGAGPANGGGIAGTKFHMIEGEYDDICGSRMKFVGASNTLTASTSAYAVFDGNLPEKCFFAVAKDAFGTEADGNIFNLKSPKSPGVSA